MKKLTAILITAIFVLALSACDYDMPASVGGFGVTNQEASPGPQGNSPSGSAGNVTDETGTGQITREQAIQIALDHAGLARDQVRELEAEPDVENGIRIWEVDFEQGTSDYSYDIDMASNILHAEKELDD